MDKKVVATLVVLDPVSSIYAVMLCVLTTSALCTPVTTAAVSFLSRRHLRANELHACWHNSDAQLDMPPVLPYSRVLHLCCVVCAESDLVSEGDNAMMGSLLYCGKAIFEDNASGTLQQQQWCANLMIHING